MLLTSILFGCAEKRVMPSNPTEQILYHVDVRARIEQWPRVNLELVGEHRRALQHRLTKPFDLNRPWS